MSPPEVDVVDVTIQGPHGPLLSRVSFSVPAGGKYALVGRGEGPRELLRCASGDRRPDGGDVTVGGWPPRRARRKLGRALLALDGVAESDAASHLPAFDLAVAADPSVNGAARLAAVTGTVLLATAEPDVAAAAGGRVGLLRRGRLIVEGGVADLVDRFRRIRYANRLTESRTVFGTELDEFHAVRVRVRGWGVEAIVADFCNDSFERFRAVDGVEDVTAAPLSFVEIVEAVVGD